MKQITGASLLGLLISLYIIYLLQPLNNGAITLIIILFTGVTVTIIKLISNFLKRKNKND